MFSYVSFRALASLILSLIISMVAGEYFIKYMRKRKHIEEARDASIDPYGVQKKVTVTGALIPIICCKPSKSVCTR